MIVHMFMLRWKSEATEADKVRALRDVMAFEGRIPGLLEVKAGVNFSERARGHELGAAMKFESRAALDGYMVHPEHLKLLEWLVPLVEATDFDFEA